MNIVTAGFFHESNSFNPIVTGPDEFLVFKQDEIYKNKNAYLIAKGIIDFFETKDDCRLFPLIFAKAVPNGEIDYDYYQELKSVLLENLEKIDHVDAFVLALHGSMRVKNIGSAETDILKSIRNRYPQTPIYCALDMHATITREMLSMVTAMNGFKTAPHLDAFETGYNCAQMAFDSLKEGYDLTMSCARFDCLIAGEKSETDTEPMKSLINELHLLEKQDDVISATILLGFPWADAEENGVTAVVVTKNNQLKANDLAQELIKKFIQKKDQFNFSMPALSPEEALIKALSEELKPVFVSDSGDNPTAGSTGDNTRIISLLSQHFSYLCQNKKILVAGIFDPMALKEAKEKMHQDISLKVGGVYDQMYCSPVILRGKPVKYIEKYSYFNSELVLFETNDFYLILTSKHIGFTNVDMFVTLGLDPMDFDVIVVKLGYLTEDFKEIAKKSYMALTQGCTDEVLSRLTYSKQFYLV